LRQGMNAQDIIAQWFDLTAVFDAGKENKLFSEISEYNKRIKLAMELDNTQITTMMIIQNVVDDYLENKEISLKTLVNDREKTLQFVDLYMALHNFLRDTDIEEKIIDFQETLMQSIRSAGMYSDAVKEFVHDRYKLAEIRLSALNAYNVLSVNQFSKGFHAKQEKIHYSNDIFEFWDINFLLKSIASQRLPDGIYLTLLKESDERFSYFAFVIKNGGGIYIVNDRPNLPSPNYKNSGRNRAIDRSFANRVNAHFFPYELMGIEWDEENERYYVDNYTNALSLFQPRWKTIGKLSECPSETLVWVFMLFSLFQNRFFGEHPYEKELSITAAMLSVGKSSNLMIVDGPVQYLPVKANPFTSLDLTNANPKVKSAWEIKPTGKNKWMEDRYASEIKRNDAINLFAPSGKKLVMSSSGNIVPLTKEIESEIFFDREEYLALANVELSDFGTPEQVERNRIFFARYNQARMISSLADKEFDREKKNILAWYRSRIEKNIDTIRQAIAKNNFESLVRVSSGTFTPDMKKVTKNIVNIYGKIRYYSWRRETSFTTQNSPYLTCYFNNARATMTAEFRIEDANAIALLCNCGIDELPVFLRNFTAHDRYSGNSILDTIDPMEVIRNPWNKLTLDLSFFISRSSYKKICKEYGTEPLKFKIE